MTDTLTIPSPTDTEALANRINFSTRDLHNKISHVMTLKFAIAIRHGFIYRQGLLAFYYIFQAIESNIDDILTNHSESQCGRILKSFWMDEFRRAPQIYKDLKLFYSNEFPTEQEFANFLVTYHKPSELCNFIQYINDTVQKEDPVNILAYCHVLYLALFAGGRLMRSSVLKNSGILFPKFEHLSHKQVAQDGINLFKFTQDKEKGRDYENKLRWKYKKNYELATRDSLSESQKQSVISVSNEIFAGIGRVVTQIGQLNNDLLLRNFNFKLLTYIREELEYLYYSKPETTRTWIKYTLLLILILLPILAIKKRSIFQIIFRSI